MPATYEKPEERVLLMFIQVHMTNKFARRHWDQEYEAALSILATYDSSAEDDMTILGGFAVRRRRSPPGVYRGSIRASNKSSL